jgi:hypothetical protein
LSAIIGLVASCAYRGDIDNPVVRKFTWFSYLDGEDIRVGCAESAVDRYRFVYNAKYEEQLRSYEIDGDGSGGADLVARAIGKGNLMKASFDDLLEPWRWYRSEARLSPEDMREFRDLLGASAMYDGAPVGLRLFSGDFYWVAAVCEDRTFYYNAWLAPGDRYSALRFPDYLYARDATGLAVNPPRQVSAAERIGEAGRREDQSETRFWLQVNEQGLGGLLQAF